MLITFEAFHRYLGAGVGEHLGYLLTGAWTLLVAAKMATATGFAKLFAIPGIVAGVGILAGLLEPAGVSAAVAVNAVGYIVWSAWLVATGIRLFIGLPAGRAAASAPALPAAV